MTYGYFTSYKWILLQIYPVGRDYILYWKLNQLVSKFGYPDFTLITQIFSKCILVSHWTFVWMLFIKALLSKMAWGMYGITELFLMKREIRESKGRTETPVFQILMPPLMLVSWKQKKNSLTMLTGAWRTKLWQENAGFLHTTRLYSSCPLSYWSSDPGHNCPFLLEAMLGVVHRGRQNLSNKVLTCWHSITTAKRHRVWFPDDLKKKSSKEMWSKKEGSVNRRKRTCFSKIRTVFESRT